MGSHKTREPYILQDCQPRVQPTLLDSNYHHITNKHLGYVLYIEDRIFHDIHHDHHKPTDLHQCLHHVPEYLEKCLYKLTLCEGGKTSYYFLS